MRRIRETRAVIHLKNLEHNTQVLRNLLPQPETFFCPMVKANGYGHGDVVISQKLTELGVQHLGVGLIEEGALLREQGISNEIIFFGLNKSSSMKELLHYRLVPVVSDGAQLEALEQLAPENYPVHVKFDTGMHRLGFAASESRKIADHFKNRSKLKLRALLTHLHTGEDAHLLGGSSVQQLKMFKKIEQDFLGMNLEIHALNSAGFLNLARNPEIRRSPLISANLGVRPGLATYGISPFLGDSIDLRPVMSLRSRIIKTHSIAAGEGVSYNQTWKANRDSIIGVVPIGYADGYHRSLSNKVSVLVGDLRASQVGNICMDYFMVDLTDILKTKSIDEVMNQEVTLFGESQKGIRLPAMELAQHAGTIVWEILTSIGVRVPREVEV